MPAPDDELEQAKRALGLDDLESAVIGDVEIGYLWAHLLSTDSMTLEDANTLAQCVRAMSKRELKVFGAVLEVRGQALCMTLAVQRWILMTTSW